MSLIILLKNTGEVKYLYQSQETLNNIIKIAEKQKLQNLLLRGIVLKSKIEFLEGNIINSYESLKSALKISKNVAPSGATIIQQELDELESNFFQWEELYKRNLGIKDRFKHSKIEKYMDYVLHHYSTN